MKEIENTKLNIDGDSLHLWIGGRLDTFRAMSVDEMLEDIPETVKNIFFDFEKLEYISSAGLRVLYWAQDYTRKRGGKALVKNVSSSLMEILVTTGFKKLISIEE